LAVERVKFCDNNVLTADSLWPVKFPSTTIKTVFRHDKWVLRPLSVYEKLLAHDVPESLLKWLKVDAN
jgi:hypothetical protein